ncbi:MAG: ornithine carbamoyltransferase, partial [Eubacteriaceae bacterium]|nr:ornithine carbamoyltransferase [Eubacteriaceae bacterium]
AELKVKKQNKINGELLKGKNIVLLFEKTSTRTRCAFEVAAYDEGANVTFLTNSQMGKKESIEDTANVLGRFYDGIEFRGFAQKTVEDLAKYSGIPVWNGLTDFDHPTQALADVLTIKENIKKPYNEIKVVYSGDGRNNVANALLIICAKLGINFTVISPLELMPEKWLVDEMNKIAQSAGGSVTLTSDVVSGVLNADVIYTDIWVSMGEEDKIKERIDLLLPYQVNMEMIKNTNNENAIFLHCLPSFHDRQTEFGEMVYQKYGISEMEVTDEVCRSKYSKVFDEAENRMHTIKAVMCATVK